MSYSKIQSSILSKKVVNPIRSVVDQLVVDPNPEKEEIKLSIGDPTIFGNLKPPESVCEKINELLVESKSNGYMHSAGLVEARKALAEQYKLENKNITADDVIIASGCSGAIELSMVATGNPGDVFLFPSPGFSLYQTVALSRGFRFEYYDLLPEQDWEIDFEHLQSVIDHCRSNHENIAGIIFLNPSNPCGSVYTKEHMLNFLEVVERNSLLVIADEIYANMVFADNVEYIPLASLTDTIPMLSVGGLAKRYMVPGWRVGWVLIYDVDDLLSEVKKSLIKLSQVILGANSLVQAAIPTMINSPPEYYQNCLDILKHNANFIVEKAKNIYGLFPVVPKGAMYMMVRIDTDLLDIKDDMDFTVKLIEEESVYVLPGSCFRVKNYIRVVFSSPDYILGEAMDRIAVFCNNHKRVQSNNSNQEVES
eukprot:TRINITY_DN11769_c0_g1_i1.p1 TRINITY_DN11769_c0_g1~~TRINITY_DN11769_c0_g1_i1.p1  ORF type:complete len:423 (+),score=126.35 TRINITY_DN11769_c0_g1_i1:90-1358(+)